MVSEEAQHRHHPDQPKTDDQAARRAPPYQQRDAEQKDHYQNVHTGMLCPNRCRCGSDRASGGRGKTGTRRSDYRKGPWRRRQPPSSVTKTTMSGDPGGWVNTGLGPVGWSAGIHQLISDQQRSPPVRRSGQRFDERAQCGTAPREYISAVPRWENELTSSTGLYKKFAYVALGCTREPRIECRRWP